MKGTEKQIKWAEDIKKAAYKTIELNIEYHKDNIEKNKDGKNTWILAKESEAYVKAYGMVKDIYDKFFSDVDDAAVIIEKRNAFSPDTIHSQANAFVRKMGN